MINKDTNHKITIVLLWITVLLNMIFADIFSFMVEIVNGGVIDIPGDVKTIMAIAGIITNIPILMIVFSWILPFKANKISNISTAIFTILYIVGGMSFLPHYYIIGSIEIILLLIIIGKSYLWIKEK